MCYTFHTAGATSFEGDNIQPHTRPTNLGFDGSSRDSQTCSDRCSKSLNTGKCPRCTILPGPGEICSFPKDQRSCFTCPYRDDLKNFGDHRNHCAEALCSAVNCKNPKGHTWKRCSSITNARFVVKLDIVNGTTSMALVPVD